VKMANPRSMPAVVIDNGTGYDVVHVNLLERPTANGDLSLEAIQKWDFQAIQNRSSSYQAVFSFDFLRYFPAFDGCMRCV
jgi:hypothetical protein